MFGRRTQKKRIDQRFEEEIVVHMDPLFGAAMRLCRDPGESDDLVQETFLKAYRFFHQYEQGTNAKAWLFRILTNTYINRYRKRRTESEVVSRLDLVEHQDRILQPKEMEVWSNPETAFFERHVGHEVVEALGALSEDYRVVIELVDLQGFSYREAADIMGTPIGTVMSRLYRARRILQSQLYDYAVHQGVLPEITNEAGEMVSLEEFRKARDAADGNAS
jgi:RNA polymerase sigma-70 factor (ECF subfamily)